MRLLVRLLDFDGGELWHHESRVRVAPNASEVHFGVATRELLGSAAPEKVVFVADLLEGHRLVSRSLHYFVKTKDLALDDPHLRVEVTRDSETHAVVKVSASKLARAVRLSTDLPSGRFSDNYFDLLPGEEVAVDWQGRDLDRIGSIKAVSLRDAY